MPDRKRKKRTADIRARAQVKREETRRAERARKRRMYLAGGGITAVIIVVVALLIGSQLSSSGNEPEGLLPGTAVTAALAQIPASTYDSAVATTSEGTFKAVPNPTLLTTASKPVVLYVGAEFCPYCAAERWALVAALDRFGTFTGLQTTTSSGADMYPDTPTLTFLNAKYTSKYLVFRSTETENRDRKPLQEVTGGSKTAWGLYDVPPYVASDDAGAIPFLDVANTYVSSGAQYLPSVLSGMNADQVAAALSNSTSKVSSAIVSSADVIVAAICKVLPSAAQQAGVCLSQGVRSGSAVLLDGTSSGSSS